MKLKYVGPFDEVDVVGHGPVKRGATFDTDKDLGDRLLEQVDNFVPAAAKKAAKPRRPKKPASPVPPVDDPSSDDTEGA